MKKLLLLALTAAFGLTAQAAQPFEKGKTAPRRHAPRVMAPPSRAAEALTLLEEDFSGFPEGTEAEPGAEITYENIYHIPASRTSTPGWTGQGVRPAGGCVSLHPWEDSYGDTRGGYISTPQLMLDGTATLTFRAKAAEAGGAELWVALCDDDYGPGYDELEAELTDQWQEFTLVASEGSLEIPSYFQFSCEEGTVLVDDVKIVFKRDRIGKPSPLHAVNVSPTEFIAGWEPVNGAEHYLLTVFCTSEPENKVEGELHETFDGINVSADGKKIDAANPGYPEGWTIDVSGQGAQDVTTEAANLCSGPLALMFDAVDDMIVSPVTPEPIDKFSFWCKPTAYSESDYGYMSLIRVELYHSITDTWENVAHLAYFNFMPEGGVYTLNEESLGKDVTRVRLTYLQRGEVDFYIDDVKLHYATRGVTAPLLEDFKVEDTKYTVSGINPANEYTYYVKAVRDDIVSAASYMIWVDGITGLKVETLEPSDLSSTSFTARWNKLGHATTYTVNAFRSITPETDMADVTILEESFDNITEGTVENPGMDWVSPFNFAEKGWAATAWCATQPAWAAGMAGTTGTNVWMGVAGLVYTPVLDLSCYDGKGITVDGTFVTTVDSFEYQGAEEPEGVFAILMDSSNLTQPIASGLLDTPVQGSTTGRIRIENVPEGTDLSKVVIAFMNKSGLAFFVDYAKISMNVPAGKTLSTPLTTVSTDKLEHTFSDLDPNSDHAYSVSASATYNYETYVSEASDLRHVKTSQLSVAELEGASGKLSATGAAGCLSVSAAEGVYTEVYTPAGMRVGSGYGSYTLPLGAGIYVVRSGSDALKVLVR